ncbi:MAG: DNA repair protein RecN [Anaerolineae bacterium]|nr:DNA repair protein RecN [Anaerolineae bacterium]
MLSELTINNFAIIDELHLRFSPGFNVLTGETGAGKSIIIDAVSLLLGGRADTGVIRAGADEARVEGIFTLNPLSQEAILPLLRENGLEGDRDDTLILAREIRREGRSVCRVNGRAVTLAVLGSIGQQLVDIHGQSEHLSLLRVREHLEFLDRYAGLGELRARLAAKVIELRRVRRELDALLRDERELARRADLLQYQVSEIAAAHLEIGEEEELMQERSRLANAERLMELAGECYRILDEGSEEQASVIDLMGQVTRALSALSKIDAGAADQSRMVDEITDQLAELARQMRRYMDGIEFSPRRLQQVEERLDLIYRLKRKYGDSIAEILAFQREAEAELEAITGSEERVEELRRQEDVLLHEIGQLGAELSARRREAGDRLAAEVETQLDDLRMAEARFYVSIEQTESPDGAWVGERRLAFDSTGLDRVEFLIAPNVGEPLKPLAKVASGGETSRLMLALRTVLSHADRTPTLIFDEIDQGIGGRAGGVVGRKLWGLSTVSGANGIAHQVLCVTHLPQLASYGDAHFKVNKQVVGERTITQVQELSPEARVEELAQMLGVVSEVTRKSAREILEQARQDKDAH